MDDNPYAPPLSELQVPSESAGDTVMPFEDPVGYPSFGGRILETLRWLFLDLHRAGRGLGGSRRVGPPVGFYALLALIPLVLVGLLGIIHPTQPIWQVWMGAPRAQAPTGVMLGFMLLGILVAEPIGAGVGILAAGALDHLGLWIVRGTKADLGIPVTYRAVIYATTVVSLASLPFHLLGHLPGALGSYAMLPVVPLQVCGIVYQGVLLARAHRTDTWRGVLGVWLPILVLVGLAGICVGALWFLGGEVFQRALADGLRGRM